MQRHRHTHKRKHHTNTSASTCTTYLADKETGSDRQIELLDIPGGKEIEIEPANHRNPNGHMPVAEEKARYVVP